MFVVQRKDRPAPALDQLLEKEAAEHNAGGLAVKRAGLREKVGCEGKPMRGFRQDS